jgi:NADPH:quinone reductase-like Zn-dependent oxidoreductase
VPPQRISTVAAGSDPPEGVIATGAHAVDPAALDRITDAIASGDIAVPIAATFPIEEIRDAVMLQFGRHVHGKVIVTM